MTHPYSYTVKYCKFPVSYEFNIRPPTTGNKPLQFHSECTGKAVLGLLSSNPVFLLIRSTPHQQPETPRPLFSRTRETAHGEGIRWTSPSGRFNAAPSWVAASVSLAPAAPPTLAGLCGEGEGTSSTWKGFSPVWTSWCRFSFELSTKALPHSAQTWTRGPWVCRCFRMAELSLNIFVQPFGQREKLSGSHCKLLQRIQPLKTAFPDPRNRTPPDPPHLHFTQYRSRNIKWLKTKPDSWKRPSRLMQTLCYRSGNWGSEMSLNRLAQGHTARRSRAGGRTQQPGFQPHQSCLTRLCPQMK